MVRAHAYKNMQVMCVGIGNNCDTSYTNRHDYFLACRSCLPSSTLTLPRLCAGELKNFQRAGELGLVYTRTAPGPGNLSSTGTGSRRVVRSTRTSFRPLLMAYTEAVLD